MDYEKQLEFKQKKYGGIWNELADSHRSFWNGRNGADPGDGGALPLPEQGSVSLSARDREGTARDRRVLRGADARVSSPVDGLRAGGGGEPGDPGVRCWRYMEEYTMSLPMTRKTGPGAGAACADPVRLRGRERSWSAWWSTGRRLQRRKRLLTRLCGYAKGMTSITLERPNTGERTNVIMGDSYKAAGAVGRKGYITDEIGDCEISDLSPLSFYQVNPAQTEKLYGTGAGVRRADNR